MNRFEGKHVAVTGAARGIGLAIAERLAAEGARLTLIDRDEPSLEGATIRVVDISDRDAVSAAFTEPLDGLVANAGIGGGNEPGATDRFDEILQTNLYGTYWCARAAEPLLPDGGRIVVISSILSRIGVAAYTAFAASRSSDRSPATCISFTKR